MTNLAQVEIIYVYNILVIGGVHGLPPTELQSAFSITSVLDMVRETVARPCESMKNILGLSYEQVLAKNRSGIIDALKFDEITDRGNVKHNLTARRRLSKMTKNAEALVILIHGFLENTDGAMVSLLGPKLTRIPRYKVFALDGSKVIGVEYLRSSTYARFVGETLGQVLSDMIEDGQNPEKVMLIGHSLGSHIAGVAGKKVQKLTGRRIGRIIALDPAGPCFSGAPVSRLDSDDASYVEVVHTNAGYLGLAAPIGHRDFYPNGGRQQPGCALATCSHSRAWEYFAESIDDPMNFPAVKCENWELFSNGSCTKTELAYMGMDFEDLRLQFNSDKKTNNIVSGSYFLHTASAAPYGLGIEGSRT